MYDSIIERTEASSGKKDKYLGVISIEMTTNARIFRYNREGWSSIKE